MSVGLYGGAAQLMPAMLPLRAGSFIGSYVGSLAEMGELMALARQGRAGQTASDAGYRTPAR